MKIHFQNFTRSKSNYIQNIKVTDKELTNWTSYIQLLQKLIIIAKRSQHHNEFIRNAKEIIKNNNLPNGEPKEI